MSVKFISFDTLTCHAVNSLNRDERGSLKQCTIGGVNRIRISSQCIKRAVRTAMRNFGLQLGLRSAQFEESILEYMQTQVGTPDSKTLGKAVKKLSELISLPSMSFYTATEIQRFCDLIAECDYDEKNITEAKIKALPMALDNEGLDIALFGRMVASSKGCANHLRMEGAAYFSHAYTTHEATPEYDFFVATDDLADKVSPAGFLGKQARILGNSITEMKAFKNRSMPLRNLRHGDILCV